MQHDHKQQQIAAKSCGAAIILTSSSAVVCCSRFPRQSDVPPSFLRSGGFHHPSILTSHDRSGRGRDYREHKSAKPHRSTGGEPSLPSHLNTCVSETLLTQHPAPSTQHPAPSTQHPAPSTQPPAPSTQHPAPSTQHPAPSTQHPAPSNSLRRVAIPMDCSDGFTNPSIH